MKFALFGNTYQAKKSAHIERLLSILEKHEAEITISREFYDFLTEDQHLSIPDAHTFEGNNFEADMVLSIGGDGSFLKAASLVGDKGTPILGINTGRLGFLADVSPEEMAEAKALVEPEFYAILEKAAKNIRLFHEKQKRNSFIINDRPGIVMGQKVIPMDKAGLYVPGGTAAYPSTVLMDAMGQLFYSISVAMGIMITYGSYVKKDTNLVKSVNQIEIFDTGVAFLAGLMIIPSVFVFSGGDEAALGKGPGLMFEALPHIFDGMIGGSFIGAAFFLMVFFSVAHLKKQFVNI